MKLTENVVRKGFEQAVDEIRALSLQTDEGGSENDGRENGKDNECVNDECECDCEKKSNNQEPEDLHSASNPLPRGQVKRQEKQPRLE